MIERTAWRPLEGGADRALVLLSGGVDSAVALAWAAAQGWNVRPVGFAWPGRPRREVEASRQLARSAGLPPPLEIDAPLMRMTGSPRYPWARAPGEKGGEDLPAGYVPHRNLVFYALALVVAAGEGAKWIVGGQLKTDGNMFADSKAAFFEGLNALVDAGLPPGAAGSCRIVLPLIDMTKDACVQEGARLKARLDLSWSCYLDGVAHCGTCAGCIDRRIAFQNTGVDDRTSYVAPLPQRP